MTYKINNIEITEKELDELNAQRDNPHKELKECWELDNRCRFEFKDNFEDTFSLSKIESEWREPNWYNETEYRIIDNITPAQWKKHHNEIAAHWERKEIVYELTTLDAWKLVHKPLWDLDVNYRVREEFEYPLFKRWIHSGEVVRFSALIVGTTVLVGGGLRDVGCVSNTLPPHTDEGWQDLPFNKERDLYHTQLVYVWDNDYTHIRAVALYNAVYDCVFSLDGERSGATYNNYKAIDPSKYEPWMIKMQKSIKL